MGILKVIEHRQYLPPSMSQPHQSLYEITDSEKQSEYVTPSRDKSWLGYEGEYVSYL